MENVKREFEIIIRGFSYGLTEQEILERFKKSSDLDNILTHSFDLTSDSISCVPDGYEIAEDPDAFDDCIFLNSAGAWITLPEFVDPEKVKGKFLAIAKPI